MGVLLRGPQENFNPQIHTVENSLALKMMKHNAVKKKALTLFSRYNRIMSWQTLTGRVNGGARAGMIKKYSGDTINDNAYRISYEGALFVPAYSFGAAVFGAVHPDDDMTSVVGVTYTGSATSTTIKTDTIGSIAVKHDPTNNIWGDKYNETDKIALGGGLGIDLIIIDGKRISSTGDHYIYNVKTIGPATLFDESHLAADEVLTDGGNIQGEGSLGQYQRSTKNKWRINYSAINRYELTMTGSAKNQKVQFVYNNEAGKKTGLWEYTEVLKAEKFFAAAVEMHSRYSKRSMQPTGHKWFETAGLNQLTLTGFSAKVGLTAPMQGDGYITQILDSGTLEYDPNTGLAIGQIEAGMTIAAERSPAGPEGNTFLMITDNLGAKVVDAALKKLISWGESSSTNTASNVDINIVTGAKNEIGFTMNAYYYMGNKVIVIVDELLSNPGFFAQNGGVTGTGHIFMINATPVDGVSNFETFNGGNGRGYIKKYVDGMHSFGDDTNKAANGFDGMKVHLLRESLQIVYSVKSSVIFKATAKYNGGALAGTDYLTDNPNAMSYIF